MVVQDYLFMVLLFIICASTMLLWQATTGDIIIDIDRSCGVVFYSGQGRDDRRHAMIVQVKGGYRVLSSKGRNLGGPYKTKAEALKRLRQVEFFKRQH